MSASVVHVSFHSGQADVKTPETVGDFGTEIFELSVHGRDASGYDADLMTRVFPEDLSTVKTFVHSIEALIDPIKSESDELHQLLIFTLCHPRSGPDGLRSMLGRRSRPRQDSGDGATWRCSDGTCVGGVGGA